jgi:MFS family permease
MGFSPNVYAFVILRFLQGMFTGTINAAMTMVSSGTPNDRQGFALGTLSTGVFAGNLFGPMVGGFLADEIGYRNTFILSAIFLLAAGFIVTLGVRENFVRPAIVLKEKNMGWKARLSGLGPGLPILALILFMNMARTFDQPILPLFIQEIHGRLEGASRWTGLLNGVAAVGAMLAGIILGRLSDRLPPHLIGKFSAVGAGIFMGITAIFPIFAVVFPARFFMSFCSGGLDPVFMVWLSKATPPEKRGTIFGWAVTARSIGWGIAPAISGGIAVAIGLRPVFIAGMILYFILVPVIHNVSQSFDVKKV